MVNMWSTLLSKFEKYPAQQKVLKLIFERGFQVNDEGKVTSGAIEIAHTQLAREAGVDRRVVDSTTEVILSDELLRKVFQNVRSIPFLRDVAPLMGQGVVVITPDDASHKGIISEVSTVIAQHNISIRQAVSDDPFFVTEAKLTIITDTKVPGSIVEELLKLDSVKGVSIY
jgi:Predicted regulator of amino acid metabolism, contains ACT domain